MVEADPHRAQFDVLFSKSGLTLSPDRQEVLFRCYLEVTQWGRLIRSWPSEPADEPANAFRVRTIPPGNMQ